MSNVGGAGFNKYAAGAKRYGIGIVGPNTGMKLAKEGYQERATQQRARNAALLKWVQGRNGARSFAKPQSQIGRK
ncbi:MAG: hypothetical protein EBS38_03140 [Actinobacteria bacterium]|nr:hypothetical protein [Actinomycetota bacterium]